MANTNVTFSTPIVDFLGCAYPALGNFKTKGGHTPIQEIYTHTSTVAGSDAVVDAIADVLLANRATGIVSPSTGQEIPIVLPVHTMSPYTPSLDYSATLMSTGGIIELDLDSITTSPTVLTLGTPFPLGSLNRPI